MAPDATTRAVLIEPATAPDLTRIAGAFLATFPSRETRDAYGRDLARWFEHCAMYGVDPLQARRPVFDVYMRAMEDAGLAANTRNRRLCTLKSFYSWCFDESLVDGNPVARVKGPRRERPEMPAMTQSEAHRYALAAEADPDPSAAPAIHLMLLVGLRVSEACGADLADLRQEGWTDLLTVRGKGDKKRTVEVPPRVGHAVRAAVGDREIGPLILNRAGRRLNPTNARAMVLRVAKAADVQRHLSPHCLRRTFIQLALDAGAPIRDVQIHVGHSDTRTTSMYDRRSLAPGKSPAYAVQMQVA